MLGLGSEGVRVLALWKGDMDLEPQQKDGGSHQACVTLGSSHPRGHNWTGHLCDLFPEVSP